MTLTEDLLISPFASSLIGALSGSVEVLIQQPAVTWKNAVQVLVERSLSEMAWKLQSIYNVVGV